jgi:uncharacterized phage protein (TIGR01671 family)
MNRDIEFRGKDIRTGKWIYGYLRKIWSSVDSRERFTICPAERFANDGFTDTGEVEVIPETVGQYTGLKDKNGRKIFEGDIVSFNFHEKIDVAVVLYKETSFMLKTKTCIMFGLGCSLDSIEVIGNIHDNPKILEVQNREWGPE